MASCATKTCGLSSALLRSFESCLAPSHGAGGSRGVPTFITQPLSPSLLSAAPLCYRIHEVAWALYNWVAGPRNGPARRRGCPSLRHLIGRTDVSCSWSHPRGQHVYTFKHKTKLYQMTSPAFGHDANAGKPHSTLLTAHVQQEPPQKRAVRDARP